MDSEFKSAIQSQSMGRRQYFQACFSVYVFLLLLMLPLSVFMLDTGSKGQSYALFIGFAWILYLVWWVFITLKRLRDFGKGYRELLILVTIVLLIAFFFGGALLAILVVGGISSVLSFIKGSVVTNLTSDNSVQSSPLRATT
jgi:uncharacterized membrane protein YhaH (DUF805 family)